jgi:hypothetical protein
MEINMWNVIEQCIAAAWNRFHSGERGARNEYGGLDLGSRVTDGEVTRRRVSLPGIRRTMHIAVLGKTGTGKTSLLRQCAAQDIAADRPFAFFDVHGTETLFLLETINARERREHRHLSGKLVLAEPHDDVVSVGLNPLEMETPDFVRVAEFSDVLKNRFGLDHFGARTEELLRNALYVLAANHLTLVELGPLLTHPGFRAAAMKAVTNAEVRQYFEERYDAASEAMRAVMREPVFNKVSAFTADPRFRHILGQAQSTFSLREAMDEGFWVIVNLDKGRLGPHALTLGSLIMTALSHAAFTRKKRSLFTIYADEFQNLVSMGSDIETMLSEARKFGVGIVASHQFQDQLTSEMRGAMLSVGTHVFFQLSSRDAADVGQALDGGKSLAERLKNLPARHCIVKSGADRWVEVRVPTVTEPKVDVTDLVNRTRYTRGRVRAHIERDIAARQATFAGGRKDVLDDWQ